MFGDIFSQTGCGSLSCFLWAEGTSSWSRPVSSSKIKKSLIIPPCLSTEKVQYQIIGHKITHTVPSLHWFSTSKRKTKRVTYLFRSKKCFQVMRKYNWTVNWKELVQLQRKSHLEWFCVKEVMNSSLYLHCATPFLAEDTKCFRFSVDIIYLAICRQPSPLTY